MNSEFATFYFVRHGETESNIKQVIEGHSDSPLTEKGESDIKALAQKLEGIHFDAVFSSDLLRAKRTAEAFAIERQLAINTTELLRERNFGIFEGKPRSEYQEANKKLIEQAKALPREERVKFRFHESMESREEMTQRLLVFVREAAVTYPGKIILVVTHGGIMISLLRHLGYEDDYEISNGGNLVLESDGVDFVFNAMEGISIRKSAAQPTKKE